MGDVRVRDREGFALRPRAGWSRVAASLRVGALLAVALLYLGCGESPVASAPVDSVSISPPTLTLLVNATAQVTAQPHAADGTALSGHSATWASANDQVATVSATGLVRGIAAGATIATAMVDGHSGSVTITVTLPPAASITVAPAPGSVLAGQSLQLTATAKDAGGTAIVGKAFSWSTTSAAVATVDNAGRVTGVSAGTATITASADNVSGSSVVTVTVPPAASVTVAPTTTNVAVAGTVQLTATARDAGGGVIAGKSFVWSSSSPTNATVTQTGLVSGVAVGTATVTATADNVSGSTVVTVQAASSVAVTQVTPATLVEGQSATLTGSGFSTIAASDRVVVDGALAQITQATATSLQFVVPTFDCQPKRSVSIVASVGSDSSNPLTGVVAPASYVSLAVGQQVVLQGAADRCLQFDATSGSERYVVGVQSVLEAVTNLTSVTVSGVPSPGGATTPPLAVPALRALPPAASPADLEVAARWRDHQVAEVAASERERAFLQPMLERRLALAPSAAAAPTVPGTVQVGDSVAIRYNNVDGNSCTQFTPISAKVRKISARGIFVEDTGNPAQLTQAQYDQAGADFDALYDIDVDNFGQPSDIDANQRVVIVVTKEVNKVQSGSLLGFVAYANFFPVAQCVASNEGEVFFLRAADPTGQYKGGVYSAATLLNDFPTLLAHEFSHVIQASRRIAVNGSFMVSWLAEGLATAAQEVAGFQRLGLRDAQDYSASSVYPSLGADAHTYFSYMSDLLAYFGYDFSVSHLGGAPEECSWVGGASTSGSPGPCSYAARLVYGVPWTVMKTAIDRHAGGAAGQKQIFRALSDHVGPASGFADLEAVFGVPMTTLVTEWAPMLYLDDRYPQAGFQLANWNLRDLAAAWRSPNAELLARARPFGSFGDVFNVRAGSVAYFDVSGAGRPATALRVRGAADAALPSFVVVWAVRVQ